MYIKTSFIRAPTGNSCKGPCLQSPAWFGAHLEQSLTVVKTSLFMCSQWYALRIESYTFLSSKCLASHEQ